MTTQKPLEQCHSCPICENGSNRITNLKGENGQFYDVCTCQSCGLAFISSTLELSLVRSFYNAEFYDSTLCAGINPLREMSERRVVKAQMRKIGEHTDVPGRILDVGCGDGVHLKLFRELGWEVYGTEISEFAAKHIKEEYGIDVWVGDLLNAPFKSGQFDVIQMRHVIEHLTHLRETIAKTWDLLKYGGLICIDTPNRGLVSRIYPFVEYALIPLANLRRRGMNRPLLQSPECSDRWGNLHPPEHNFWFTPNALELLLEATSFKNIKIKTTYRGNPNHYPSKAALRGNRINWWDKLWFYGDILATQFGDGGILVAYAEK